MGRTQQAMELQTPGSSLVYRSACSRYDSGYGRYISSHLVVPILIINYFLHALQYGHVTKEVYMFP